MGLALTLERLVTVATEGNIQRYLHEDNNNGYAGIIGVILPNKIQTNGKRLLSKETACRIKGVNTDQYQIGLQLCHRLSGKMIFMAVNKVNSTREAWAGWAERGEPHNTYNADVDQRR